ncbi:hypothetical protein MIMGU_mgv1a022733mg [Erythranthe guttata]|uniref:HTH myb-type domain-containing protein n=1 Tax=Erythranthe guttata TaxID=4155 RepID=A0A022RLG1_ERYGU|nr:hypothetical protein MIMGU_mgv1a022733mg [Erythranthe guttata]
MQKCNDYIHALEEERSKIQVFQRDLPLCLDLVTQAIETCKQQLTHEKSGCNSEQTSNDDVVPVLEEFMPIKRAADSDSDQDQDQSEEIRNIGNFDINSKKSDWLKSVQLWNQTPDPPSKQDSPRKSDVVELRRERKEGQSQNRKARRCWSPELHRRFLQAIQQLGGGHVGTPKQIRELMKVDGLTNDEVKSHLQKYRLHTRRPSTTIHNNNTQAPQFVVVGGIWMQPEYAAMATTATSVEESGSGGGAAASKGIYAPVAAAAPPPPFREAKHKPSSSHSSDGGGARSYSPATSSSTHTQ